MSEILQGKRAVIFDLDGTLIHTPKDVLASNINITLQRVGLPMRSKKEILKFYRDHNWDETLRGEWGLDEEKFNRFWKVYNDYIENREDDGPCLERLKTRGLKLGVISSCNPIYLERQIKKIGPHLFDFDSDVGHRTSTFPKKPDPTAYWDFLERVKISLIETVAVGNSDLDTLTAREARVLDVLIDRGENSFSIEPSYSIKSLEELR